MKEAIKDLQNWIEETSQYPTEDIDWSEINKELNNWSN